jgi:hypothetical protein
MEIKRGATRIVFVFKKNVIKIPNFKEYRLFIYGISANIQEKIWSRVGRDDLAKVKFCSPFAMILVMERAQVYNEEELSSLDWIKFADDLQKKYKDDDFSEFMLSDLKPSNWGTIGNRLVKIDYGN